MDWHKLGLKCGLEIHQRLNTEKKLFCSCPARMSSEKPAAEIRRRLRASAGELGVIDEAALHEVARGKTFVYKVYDKESCAVELDEEPPHALNLYALESAIKIALLLKARMPDEIHVMRKTVIDGSNTGGFQRTALVGVDGVLKYDGKEIGIDVIALEEESAQIIGRKDDVIIYGLDRLGIPLVEIGTAPSIKTPEQAVEVARALGKLVRSGGMAQRGIGTIRQDVNVSIRGGARTEIKGAQDIRLLPAIIEKEVERQQAIIRKGRKPRPEARRVLPDSSTEFMRPLSGAARMYVETDVPPVKINKEMLSTLTLPETLADKEKRFISRLGLHEELASAIIKSPHLELFEELASKSRLPARETASIFVNTLPDLRRRGVNVDGLPDSVFRELIVVLEKKDVSKEAVPGILEACASQKIKAADAIEKLGLKAVSEKEALTIVRRTVKANKGASMGAVMGLVMKELRGRIDGRTVARLVKKEMG